MIVETLGARGKGSRLPAWAPALILAAVLATVLGNGMAKASAAMPSPEDVTVVKSALAAAESGKWTEARRLAAGGGGLPARIVQWFDLTRPGTKASFSEIAGFMAANPDWPDQRLLRRHAEAAITANIPPGTVLSWFREHPPVSAVGSMRLGAALRAAGEEDEGRRVLREAWVAGNFNRSDEQAFFKRYHGLLTREDHEARLERLLWEGFDGSVRRMLWRVTADYRALAEARYLLRHMRGNVDKAIARVPAELRDHPGLVYERLRWRRRKGRDDSALELLEDPPADPMRPELWWRERAILAHRALADGQVSVAYRLARDHGLEKGAGFAEGEWLAGWIALRFLGETEVARGHFMTMFEAVRYPMSKARAAYWTARAATTAKATETAKSWFATAAGYPTTYYGQLAATWSDPGNALKLPTDPTPSPEETEAFEDHELVHAIRLLGQAGERDRIKPFILSLGGLVESPGWQVLTAALARGHGRPDLAIAVAKRSTRAGHTLIAAGYPALIPPPVSSEDGRPRVEVPLVLALVRQESAYNPKASSGAGARGLMQLLPGTARRVAKDLGTGYSLSRLTSDPDYNLRLGQTYLAGLLERFDGSYVLALAAYNAGPSRALSWMRQYGDPRDREVDVVDWIELIPFEETRNYIQRVMEGLQVYRLRLAETKVVLTLEKDLER